MGGPGGVSQQHRAAVRLPALRYDEWGVPPLQQLLHGLLIGLEGPVKVRPGKSPLGDELVGQGGIRPLQLGEEGGGGDLHGVAPAEVLPVHPLGQDAAGLSQRPGVVPGEVLPIHVVQGPEHEGHVHRSGGGLPGAEGGVRGALGEAVFPGIGHIAVGPGGHIGEGVGLLHCRRLVLLAQGPDQHGHRLLPGEGAVQGEVGGAVRPLPHPQEEAQALELAGQGLLLRQVPALRRSGSAQAQRQAQQGAQRRSDPSSHLMHLHILADFSSQRPFSIHCIASDPVFVTKNTILMPVKNGLDPAGPPLLW